MTSQRQGASEPKLRLVTSSAEPPQIVRGLKSSDAATTEKVVPLSAPRAIAAAVATDPKAFQYTNVASSTVPFERPSEPHMATPVASGSASTQRPANDDVTLPFKRERDKAPTPRPTPSKSAPVKAIAETKRPVAPPQAQPKIPALFETLKRGHASPDATLLMPRSEPAILIPAPAAANEGKRWAAFERIGLGAKAGPRSALQRLLVSLYKMLGFAILTLIVVVLVGYIASTVFYFVSKSWVTPTVVSPSDDKVVQLKTELAAQLNNRDKLLADLHESERAIAAEREFQIEFGKAIKADLEGRKQALDRVRQLAGAAASTRVKIRSSNEEYAKASADKMQKDYDAHLIDERSKLGGNYQLAQISTSTLGIAERQAELERQAQELSAQTRSLDALLAQKDTALSYDVLKIKRDYDASKLALAKAVETQKTVTASLARQDEIIAGVNKSGYLRALADHATVALVPYANLDAVTPGTSLYACKVAMLWCHEVGTVVEVLPGEVQFKHPHRDVTLRGHMVELKLTDATAGEDDVLFAGGRPLGF